MLRRTTIQERLWELRKDKGLNLEELAQQTGISKSALASYEANDNKEINHGNLSRWQTFIRCPLIICSAGQTTGNRKTRR